MGKYTIGSISHGTMRPEDLIPEFIYTLKQLDTEKRYARLIEEAEAITDFDSDEASEILNEDLFNALNEFAPPYFYFGSHPGDGSDYGFWLSEDCLVDFDGLKVNDTSEVPEDYVGEVIHVNDHGNTTLYVADGGKLTEIWAIV
jgi:hypothetical protein